MPEIKVVGDIRSGKYQPTLTGNAIVDAALIDHFCHQLATALHLPNHQVTAEHHWNQVVAPHVIYIIETRIWQASLTPGDHQNVITVPATDLQRGQIKTACAKLAPRLTQSPMH
ncbi:hypothetical protein [Levilactobacillus namurensis]|uniref:Uncharacterized protein n=1 Tax=Levilactobacillus namurensis TaxID=380393 RepID=A0AAW8W7V8_9LACO|nr:hypothetical protein [Levilactobacillus namurensis]PTM23441.1 hypothetical protein DA798_03770 [Lactobacillus sp. PFC-70]MCW3777957.1 hypothetical protein [Levilactobacillus namurensis]MDT7014838.1 hypothetical protein [Levilactobacillus namurensis]MDT7018305.1 hypothetical protein [Levilactobacillus namurensis]WNN64708.1 hypothetical protein RIN67_08280 [Levilactobacillus namurensis]